MLISKEIPLANRLAQRGTPRSAASQLCLCHTKRTPCFMSKGNVDRNDAQLIAIMGRLGSDKTVDRIILTD